MHGRTDRSPGGLPAAQAQRRYLAPSTQDQHHQYPREGPRQHGLAPVCRLSPEESASIVTEMAASHDLELVRQHNYPASRSMRCLNPNARRYDERWSPTETVLEFVAA